jgi:hypothetical protein
VNTSSRFVLGRALLLAALVAGCKESTGPGPRGATTLTVQSGDEQQALVGNAVALPLRVLVTNDEGDPVPNVLVNFAVKTGGGTITGGAARSDDDGVATAGVWTLGAFLGEHTVEASVTGLESVTFTANARCTTNGALALDATVTGSLIASDCKYPGGELTDRFLFTTAQQRAVRFSQTGPAALNTYLEIYDAEEGILAFNNDSADVAGHPSSVIKILLAPGTYELSPSAFAAGVTGNYSLTATAVPESSNTCNERVFAMRGITTIAELAAGDCVTAGSPSYLYERYLVVMHAGQTYTISMNSTTFNTYLELGPLNGAAVASNDDATGTNARITFTPTVSNFYVIVASSSSTGESGAYTLIIQ